MMTGRFSIFLKKIEKKTFRIDSHWQAVSGRLNLCLADVLGQTLSCFVIHTSLADYTRGQCYKTNTGVIYCHFRLNYHWNIYNIEFSLE
jgi:hypothetical protein